MDSSNATGPATGPVRDRGRPIAALALLTVALAAGCSRTSPEAPDASGATSGAGERGDPAPESPAVALVDRALREFLAARGKSLWPASSPRIALARDAQRNGEEQLAEDILAQELAEQPANGEALLMRAVMHYQKIEMAAAKPGLERVLAEGPTFNGAEFAFYYYGGCLLRLGDDIGARHALDAHLELVPGNGESLFLLGELELQRGDDAAALERYRESAAAFEATGILNPAIAPSRARAYTGIARALISLDDLEGAQAALLRSMEIAPTEPQNHYLMSRVHLRLGDKANARHSMVDFKRLESGLPPRFHGQDGSKKRSPADQAEEQE